MIVRLIVSVLAVCLYSIAFILHFDADLAALCSFSAKGWSLQQLLHYPMRMSFKVPPRSPSAPSPEVLSFRVICYFSIPAAPNLAILSCCECYRCSPATSPYFYLSAIIRKSPIFASILHAPAPPGPSSPEPAPTARPNDSYYEEAAEEDALHPPS